jgi:hypothetical protein
VSVVTVVTAIELSTIFRKVRTSSTHSVPDVCTMSLIAENWAAVPVPSRVPGVVLPATVDTWLVTKLTARIKYCCDTYHTVPSEDGMMSVTVFGNCAVLSGPSTVPVPAASLLRVVTFQFANDTYRMNRPSMNAMPSPPA